VTTKVAYITTARSDYGPSFWLLHDLFADSEFEVALVVGGSHLSGLHGNTVQEIERDGWPIAARIPFLDDNGDDCSLAVSAGRALTAFGKFFERCLPDIAVICGDRYELLPIAAAAVITGTPLAHLWGGDITEGAIDEQVRHALTKIAHLHFPSTELSAKRIRQMGEEEWRVRWVGDTALDHFNRGEFASPEELAKDFGFAPSQSDLLVTFHPATLELQRLPEQVAELSAALRQFKGHIIITAPAPDRGGALIRSVLQDLTRSRPKTIFIESLGSRRYRGLLRQVGAVVGNSSSGLIEAASVPLAVVNVGNRQRGRERAANVIDAPLERKAILAAIERGLSPAFRETLLNLTNPYGDGCAAKRIVDVLLHLPARETLLTKRFWTI
jgi:UDP-hydrolysing UDP-N-acetyl-D-glucosamine 2-epimerase